MTIEVQPLTPAELQAARDEGESCELPSEAATCAAEEEQLTIEGVYRE